MSISTCVARAFCVVLTTGVASAHDPGAGSIAKAASVDWRTPNAVIGTPDSDIMLAEAFR